MALSSSFAAERLLLVVEVEMEGEVVLPRPSSSPLSPSMTQSSEEEYLENDLAL